ncbi:hypothetical protein CDAR_400121 [Caerostris darwini]|uniref:Uncharacterized protein n=1 Tax=Caerostris darwini TaxID=1538125 RepID=A0AAV4PX54_9ARAC|nr:hypothetical protein CDAR_400121 [Caerostris darwini]
MSLHLNLLIFAELIAFVIPLITPGERSNRALLQPSSEKCHQSARELSMDGIIAPHTLGDLFFYQRRYPSDLLLASLLYHFTVAQYSGPHPVISRKDKTFIMTFNDKNQTASVDRMKPALFLSDNTTVCAEYKEKTPSITHDLSVTKDSFQVYFRLLQELKTPNCLTSRTCSQIHYHLLRRLSHGLADMCIFVVIY